MASERVVRRTLESIANMHGKGQWWVDDSMKMWLWQLEDVTDQDLIIGCRDLLRKTKKLPTVAQLRAVREASPSTKVGRATGPAGCPACDQTGVREMARWYTSKGKQEVYFGMAACDCPLGMRLEAGAYTCWMALKKKWEDDEWTEKVYHSTYQQPHLTTAETTTPEVLEERAERAKKMPKKEGVWRHVMHRD